MKRKILIVRAVLLAMLLCLCPLMGLADESALPPLHVLNLGDYDEADVAVILEDRKCQISTAVLLHLPLFTVHGQILAGTKVFSCSPWMVHSSALVAFRIVRPPVPTLPASRIMVFATLVPGL